MVGRKNKDQALAAAIYFMQCFSFCCVSNFLVVYLTYRHLDLHEIGIITGAVYPLAQMIGQPLWCYLADRTVKHKVILITSVIVGTAAITCTIFMTSFRNIALMVGGGSFLYAGVGPMIDTSTMACLVHHNLPTTLYGRLRVFGALGWGIAAVVIGLIVDRFGANAIFYNFAASSVVFACVLVSFPFYTHATQAQEEPDSTSSSNSSNSSRSSQRDGSKRKPNPTTTANINKSINTAVVYEVDTKGGEENTPLLASTPKQQHQEEKEKRVIGSNTDIEATPISSNESNTKRQSLWWYFKYIANQPHAILFMALTAIMGIFKGTIDAFLFVYLQDMGASATLLGVTLGVTTITEFPVFFYSGDIYKKIGAVAITLISLGAYSLRLLYYAQLTEPWLVLPAELLHGITFALSWASIAMFAQQVSPPGFKATTQGICSALFFGLGFGSGAVSGGFISEIYGLDMLFCFASCLSSGAALMGITWYYTEKKCRGL